MNRNRNLVFTIPKGNHFANLLPILFPIKDGFSAIITLDESCTYEFQDEDQYDYNKLIGIANSINPHSYSFRIGWFWNKYEQVFEFAWYWYLNGNRFMLGIDMVKAKINEPIQVSMLAKNGKLTAKVNEKWIELKYPTKNFYFMLRPYFGGQKTAEKDCKIKIDFIN
jgi:hypothetical protein